MKSKIAILVSLSSLLLFSQCDSEKWTNCIKGKGEVITETRTFEEEIRGVEMDISGRLYIKQGAASEIEIRAQENIAANIETTIKNNILWLDFDQCVRNFSSIDVILTMPKTEYLAIIGSGDIYAYDTLMVNQIELAIEGSGNMHVLVMPDTAYSNHADVETSISGSGDVELRGKATYHDIRISGSGDIFAYGMETNTTEVSISGSGDCKVQVNDFLDVDISGSGDVYYRGFPEKRIRITGSGKVINDN